MDFWVIAYILLCVCLGGGIVTILMRRQQTIASMLVLVLIILVFIFFGLRWFPGGNLNGTKPAKVPWPPIVNMCPDFMVTWTAADNKVYCYDANNVYNLKAVAAAAATAPLTSGLNISGTASESAYLIKDTSGATEATKYPLKTAFKNTLSSLLAGDAKYLRWEGVWDGYSSTPDNIPTP